LGGAVFHQVRQVFDEARGAGAAGLIALRQGEDFLELVEDQQRDEGVAVVVAQHIVAVVQELPQRFALHCGTDLGPMAGHAGFVDGLFDLLRGFGRSLGIVDAHVHRAIALGAQPRHQPGAQDGGLAQAGLAEQHCQQFALHAARQLGDFLVAAVEVSASVLGEGR
jgi:hypothetical protein